MSSERMSIINQLTDELERLATQATARPLGEETLEELARRLGYLNAVNDVIAVAKKLLVGGADE